VQVDRCVDAAAFLAQAQSWLMGAEVEHNVILSIAASVAKGVLVPKQPPYFAIAVDAGEVVACAIRTPPHKLVVSSGSAAAMQALAQDVFALAPELPALNGPEPAAGAFAAAWSGLTGKPAQPGKRQRLYVAHTVTDGLRVTSGALRRAAQQDRALALQWAAEFAREAVPDEPFDGEEVIGRYYLTESLYFWDDVGPATILVASGKTLNGARVGFVYTPPSRRRRGYATAAVAALTARLLADGNQYCCLYTDLANPTSNSIYQQVGYRPLRDINDYLLT
jgi:hypothetical protein